MSEHTQGLSHTLYPIRILVSSHSYTTKNIHVCDQLYPPAQNRCNTHILYRMVLLIGFSASMLHSTHIVDQTHTHTHSHRPSSTAHCTFLKTIHLPTAPPPHTQRRYDRRASSIGFFYNKT